MAQVQKSFFFLEFITVVLWATFVLTRLIMNTHAMINKVSFKMYHLKNRKHDFTGDIC